jgi:hypothetical protein
MGEGKPKKIDFQKSITPRHQHFYSSGKIENQDKTILETIL